MSPNSTWIDEERIYDRELIEHLKYMHIPVVINGMQINDDPSELSWDHDDDICSIKLDPLGSHSFNIYNQGVLVCEFSRYQFGINADVITKSALKQNLSRNEIAKDCPVWAHILAMVKKLSHEKNKKKKTGSIDEGYRRFMIGELLDGEKEDLLSVNIRKNNGKYMTISSLGTSKLPIVKVDTSTPSDTLEYIEAIKAAILINDNELAIWGVKSVNELLTLLTSESSRLELGHHWIKKFRERQMIEVEFATLVSTIDMVKVIIPLKELSPLQAAQRNALDYVSKLMAKRISNALNKSVPARKIHIGECPTAGGWTDSLTYIAVEKNSLKLFESPAGLFQLTLLLLHEYTHGVSTADGENHGLEFYECFHNIALPLSLQNDVLGNACASLQNAYINALSKKSLPVPKYLSELAGFERFELLLNNKTPNQSLAWFLDALNLPYSTSTSNGVHKLVIDASREAIHKSRDGLYRAFNKMLKATLSDKWVDPSKNFEHVVNYEEKHQLIKGLQKEQWATFSEMTNLCSVTLIEELIHNVRYGGDNLISLAKHPELEVLCVKHYKHAGKWKFSAHMPFITFIPWEQRGRFSETHRDDTALVEVAKSIAYQRMIAVDVLKLSVANITGELKSEMIASMFNDDYAQGFNN